MKTKKILVIDDEKNFGKTVKMCLEKMGGYEVDASPDAVEGLEQIREKAYDVIFLDILMPKMEGHEALQKIKSFCRTPVVILSAYLPPLLEKEITRQGAFACIRKPAEIDQLVSLIHQATE